MSGRSIDARQKIVAVAFACPKCGAKGRTVWERDEWGLSLVSLSGGFYERLKKLSPVNIEIVCHACGTAQPETSPQS